MLVPSLLNNVMVHPLQSQCNYYCGDFYSDSLKLSCLNYFLEITFQPWLDDDFDKKSFAALGLNVSKVDNKIKAIKGIQDRNISENYIDFTKYKNYNI